MSRQKMDFFKVIKYTLWISGDTIPCYLRQRLPVDFPVFNVQVPRNENRSHRLNTRLRALVEIAGDQLFGLQTIKQW